MATFAPKPDLPEKRPVTSCHNAPVPPISAEPTKRADRLATLRRGAKHVPAFLGVLLLIGAIYVVQREFRHLNLRDVGRAMRAVPARALVIAAIWNLLAYGVLTFYDRLATIYAGHRVSYARTALASFCAYALAHNLGFAAVSGRRRALPPLLALGPRARADRQGHRLLQPHLRPRRHVAGRRHPLRRAPRRPLVRRAPPHLGAQPDRRPDVVHRRRLHLRLHALSRCCISAAAASNCPAGAWR